MEPDGRRYIETVQDIAPTLDRIKQTRDDGWKGKLNAEARRGLKHDGEVFVRAAHIPNSVIVMWKRRYGVDIFNKDHQNKVKKLLNDPEWKYLRLATGKL